MGRVPVMVGVSVGVGVHVGVFVPQAGTKKENSSRWPAEMLPGELHEADRLVLAKSLLTEGFLTFAHSRGVSS